MSETDSSSEETATVKMSNYVAGQDVMAFTNNGSTMGNIEITLEFQRRDDSDVYRWNGDALPVGSSSAIGHLRQYQFIAEPDTSKRRVPGE